MPMISENQQVHHLMHLIQDLPEAAYQRKVFAEMNFTMDEPVRKSVVFVGTLIYQLIELY